MTINSNFFYCRTCGYHGIIEEEQNHVCRRKVLEYKIEQNILWVYDGINWFPRKLLSAEKLHPHNSNLSAEDDTEPYRWLCRLFVG